MPDLEPAPKESLNFVRCNCKTISWNTWGTNLCSCRKNGLTCVAACGDCRGESCNNSSAEMEDDNEGRNLFEKLDDFYFWSMWYEFLSVWYGFHDPVDLIML